MRHNLPFFSRPDSPILWKIIIAALIFFLSSSSRHLLFQSTAFDLGIYDQVTYLISQGLPPISSFLGIHHLGNHVAWVMYPVALLYKIYPSIYWLFLIQAVCLAGAALPTWYLARKAGLTESVANAIATAYLLYPVVFNVNLFDFHPEVMAIPALFGAILAARLNNIFGFCISILWVLGCKDALSLTVTAMGIWLFFIEKRRFYGAIALTSGIAWFIIAVYGIIPYYKDGRGPGGVGRYGYLGSTITEIIKNFFLKPQLILSRLFSLSTLEYLILLISPVLLWISLTELTPLISAIPILLKNSLSELNTQRDLIHQYSLPILPFLIVAVIDTLSHNHKYLGKSLLTLLNTQTPLNLQLSQLISIWSIIGFIALAKFGYFGSIYLNSLDTWQATQHAISLVPTQGSVLTTANIAPHLTHRPMIQLAKTDTPLDDLTAFDTILLNVRHPGWKSHPEFAQNLVNQLRQNPHFQLIYQQDEIYLFTTPTFIP